MKASYLIFSLVLLYSCASRPQLYPNDKYKTVGKEIAKADIDQCIVDADKFLESSKGKNVAKGAGAGAAIGGVIGAVSGIFTGDVIGGAARSAVVGGAAGGTVGALSPDQIKHNYVNQCLGEKGYRVLGWD